MSFATLVYPHTLHASFSFPLSATFLPRHYNFLPFSSLPDNLKILSLYSFHFSAFYIFIFSRFLFFLWVLLFQCSFLLITVLFCLDSSLLPVLFFLMVLNLILASPSHPPHYSPLPSLQPPPIFLSSRRNNQLNDLLLRPSQP